MIRLAEEKPKHDKQELSLQVHLETLTTAQWAGVRALVNSGCTNCIMDLDWVKTVGLEPVPLQKPIMMYNVDGSQNHKGQIKYGIDLLLVVGNHQG